MGGMMNLTRAWMGCCKEVPKSDWPAENPKIVRIDTAAGMVRNHLDQEEEVHDDNPHRAA